MYNNILVRRCIFCGHYGRSFLKGIYHLYYTKINIILICKLSHTCTKCHFDTISFEYMYVVCTLVNKLQKNWSFKLLCPCPYRTYRISVNNVCDNSSSLPLKSSFLGRWNLFSSPAGRDAARRAPPTWWPVPRLGLASDRWGVRCTPPAGSWSWTSTPLREAYSLFASPAWFDRNWTLQGSECGNPGCQTRIRMRGS